MGARYDTQTAAVPVEAAQLKDGEPVDAELGALIGGHRCPFLVGWPKT